MNARESLFLFRFRRRKSTACDTGWRALFDAEATERKRLERALIEIWNLPPTGVWTAYHDKVGDIARRAIEPGIGVINDALGIDPMCSYCEIHLSEHETIHAQCVEEGA